MGSNMRALPTHLTALLGAGQRYKSQQQQQQQNRHLLRHSRLRADDGMG